MVLRSKPSVQLTVLLVPAICVFLFSVIGGAGEGPSPLAALLGYEKSLLQNDESALPQSNPADRFGPDPYKILYLPEQERFLVLLRGRSEVLLVDRSLNQLNLIDRKAAPSSPAGWTLAHDRFLFVGGELSPSVQLYEVTTRGILSRGSLLPQGVTSIRDLVYVPSLRSLFLLDGFNRRLVQLTLKPDWSSRRDLQFEQKSFPIGAGPIQIRFLKNHLLINLLLDHSLLIVPLIQGRPNFTLASRITHDGPLWGFDAFASEDSLTIAAVGVEDRPLNRLGGEFGYVDSFLFIYKVPLDSAVGIYRWPPKGGGKAQRLTRNLSQLGVVTPKAVRFETPTKNLAGLANLWVLPFGSGRLARFELGSSGLKLTGNFPVPPGTTDFLISPEKQKSGDGPSGNRDLILTNSLIDRVYLLQVGKDGSSYHRFLRLPSVPSTLSRQSRLGELLFFTTLLTPHNRSEGELSRFTCEACHYEGTFDGRVHYTGRGHVFAVTKTLRGLANNVPLFSRAGDKSLASMVLAEFSAANQERKDSFNVAVENYPWLSEVDGMPPILTPYDLRVAFLSFFFDYRHRSNPRRVQSSKLSSKALRGLTVFRDRCEYCHLATVSTKETASLPAVQWQEWLESKDRDLVWGAPFYTKTGIEPYVHRAGARVPSLRRVQQKFPLFTNGSSPTLRHLLARFRYRELTAWHHYEPLFGAVEGVRGLTADEIDSLEELLKYF